MDLDDPVNQSASYCLRDLWLTSHVCWVDLPLRLLVQHVLLDRAKILAYMLDIAESLSVNFEHRFGDQFVELLLAFLLLIRSGD